MEDQPMEFPQHYGPRTLRALPEDGGLAVGYEKIGVRILSPSIGGEISGVDLGKPLDDETFAEVRRALLACKVIFFRDQHITPTEQVAFARRFGELEVHPFLPEGELPEVIRFAKDDAVKGVENLWHTDVSWREVPSMGSVLHAIDVPGVGGDTLWADMVAAYEGLPDAVRERIDGLQAVHDFSHSFGLLLSKEDLAEKQEQFPPATHPVVRTHPETGEKILYVNRIFTSRILGLEPEESARLLEYLYAQAAIPEYQVRFKWEPDSVAFWDNRSTQHYACSDYWPKERVMDRVTIIGEKPA
jgi:taurine dioxygenase